MADIKWSAFTNGGALASGDQVVGLRGGVNERFTPITNVQVQASAFNFANAGGVNDAFTVTLSPAPAALTDGLLVTMNSGFLVNLTTSPTLKVNGLTAKTITSFAGSLAPGDIQTGNEYLFIYNATIDEFQLINPSVTTADTFQVQNNAYTYALDTGIANAYIANILPVQLTIQAGFFVVMRAIHANTTASTLTVNGTTHPITDNAGAALVGGEIIANGVYYFLYNDNTSSFVLTNPSIVLANPLPLSKGGTNASLTASNGGVFYSTATAGAILAGTATAGQIIRSGASAAPTWSTSTYPATNAVSTLLYASSANVMGALTTANNGMLVTSAGGVPSIGNAVLADITIHGVTAGLGAGSVASNTAFGVQTINATATGTNNSGFGYLALSALTTGTYNTALGDEALHKVNTGGLNTAVGAGALYNCVTASNNIAMGYNSMVAFTSGSDNVCIGQGVYQIGTTGTSNIALGGRTLENCSGNYNIALGNSALFGVAPGYAMANNVAVGVNAGSNGATGAVILKDGTSNTFLGYQSSSNNASSVGVLALGSNAVADIATGATSGDNGPGIAIGSAATKVGFRGDGTIYPTAGAGGSVALPLASGFLRIKINGTYYKIALTPDA